jgi:pimeloyl-ACP methyl ester carboxylesterase
MFHERQISGSEGPIHLAEGPPSGPLLLLLHGIGRGWRDFAGLMRDLAPCWHVMGLDLRGHGRSGRTPGKYLVKDYVSDVVAIAHQLDRPLLIYGHSLGGMIAGAAAAELGRRVRGLVLEDPPYAMYAPGAGPAPTHALFTLLRSVCGSSLPVSQLARQLADSRVPAAGQPQGVRLGDLRDATSLRFGAACLKQVDPDVWNPVLAHTWLEGLDYRTLLPRITCPTLVLQANIELGGMVSAEAGEELEQLIPDCLRLNWQDSGHLIHNLMPERTLRVVSEFLDSIALDPAGIND